MNVKGTTKGVKQIYNTRMCEGGGGGEVTGGVAGVCTDGAHVATLHGGYLPAWCGLWPAQESVCSALYAVLPSTSRIMERGESGTTCMYTGEEKTGIEDNIFLEFSSWCFECVNVSLANNMFWKRTMFLESFPSIYLFKQINGIQFISS